MSDKELDLILQDKEAKKLEIGESIKKLEVIYTERENHLNSLSLELDQIDKKLNIDIPKIRKEAYLTNDQELDIHTKQLHDQLKKNRIILLPRLDEAINDFKKVKERLEDQKKELNNLMAQKNKLSEIIDNRKLVKQVINSEIEES